MSLLHHELIEMPSCSSMAWKTLHFLSLLATHEQHAGPLIAAADRSDKQRLGRPLRRKQRVHAYASAVLHPTARAWSDLEPQDYLPRPPLLSPTMLPISFSPLCSCSQRTADSLYTDPFRCCRIQSIHSNRHSPRPPKKAPASDPSMSRQDRP
jgi:hypothetical protein